MNAVPPRRADWQDALVAYLHACARLPFEPGVFDCALFAAGAIEAMTGFDPAAELRGTYATEEEGFAKIAAAGFADHIEMVARLFEEIPVSLARPGDLAAVSTPGNLAALAVVQGEHVYVPRARGFGTLPLTQASRAFRVR